MKHVAPRKYHVYEATGDGFTPIADGWEYANGISLLRWSKPADDPYVQLETFGSADELDKALEAKGLYVIWDDDEMDT